MKVLYSLSCKSSVLMASAHLVSPLADILGYHPQADGLQFYFMYNWYSSYADLSIPSASVPITKQKHTKPYNSFPNQKSVDSHHNSKSSIVCTNCFSTICKPIRISDPEILVYWTYQEWEGSVRLPVGDTPRPSLTSITRNCILSPLHSVTHVSYRLLTFERGIPYILSDRILRRGGEVTASNKSGLTLTIFFAVKDDMTSYHLATRQ